MAEKEYIDREAFVEQKRKQYCEDCNRRKGFKRGQYKILYEIGEAPCRACEIDDMLNDVEDFPAADVRPVPEGGMGEMSDGYHTFNGLYYQRMVLFAALINAYNDRAWKSWKHEDGKPCFDGGWFIVGIDTPQGSYTYHYEEKYWNWFECVELAAARHWDGHTEEDVTRLLSLPDVRPVVRSSWEQVEVNRFEDMDEDMKEVAIASMFCPNCKRYHNEVYFYGIPTENVNFCPNCGAEMGGKT